MEGQKGAPTISRIPPSAQIAQAILGFLANRIDRSKGVKNFLFLGEAPKLLQASYSKPYGCLKKKLNFEISFYGFRHSHETWGFLGIEHVPNLPNCLLKFYTYIPSSFCGERDLSTCSSSAWV